MTFVSEHDDGAGARRREVSEPDGFVGELNAENLGFRLAGAAATGRRRRRPSGRMSPSAAYFPY